jgi:hypothetical protein
VLTELPAGWAVQVPTAERALNLPMALYRQIIFWAALSPPPERVSPPRRFSAPPSFRLRPGQFQPTASSGSSSLDHSWSSQARPKTLRQPRDPRVPAAGLGRLPVRGASCYARPLDRLPARHMANNIAEPLMIVLRPLLTLAAGAALAGTALAADIRIGVAEALSGGAAQYGVPIRNGFQIAVEAINARGGVNGNRIELVVEDEQGKKEEAITVVKKLIFQDKVLMVFGPSLSNSMFAAGPVANAAKTVAFGTSNTANGITDIGP